MIVIRIKTLMAVLVVLLVWPLVGAVVYYIQDLPIKNGIRMGCIGDVIEIIIAVIFFTALRINR
jgi:hypothetical protein